MANRLVVASDPNSITQTAVALVANTSTQLLPANSARKSLAILNRGATDADVKVGGAATVGQGILAAANGGGYVFDLGAVPSGAIHAIAPAATTLIVLEG